MTQKNLQYSFSSHIAKLYKYRALSKYAINDIINGELTTTNIGNFNDLFDGATHWYGTHDERKNKAENKWDELEQLRIEAGVIESLILEDQYKDMYIKYLKDDSRLKFRMHEYLGTYVSCLSTRFDSMLMWAHYAESSTGICLEYDFNQSTSNQLIRKMIFPVAYSKTPVEINDLLDDENDDLFQYSLEAAVFCSALNKSCVWSYENEWRLILLLDLIEGQEQRIPVLVDNPISITFGFHFLKPFFYYEFFNKEEKDIAKQRIENTIRLYERT